MATGDEQKMATETQEKIFCPDCGSRIDEEEYDGKEGWICVNCGKTLPVDLGR